jgi:glycosyltransferase involved in cell wall biosynthesis
VRILWLSHSSARGGAEFALLEAVKALGQLGHESHVVLPKRGPLEPLLRDRGSKVHVIANNRWISDDRAVMQTVRWSAYNLRASVPSIARLARDIRADVTVTNTITVASGGPAARLARIPHAWFLHEYGSSDHGLVFHFGRRPTYAMMRALTDMFMVNSETLRQHFEPLLRRAPISVVRYAVEVPPTRAADTDDGAFRVILVGEKTPGKRQLDAIDATAELATEGIPITLDLVGGGRPDYERAMRDRIDQHGLQDAVRLRAFEPDVPSLVASSDVALMCSSMEAFGRVTVEAMKVGKPVVGADSGATPELIRDGWNGFLYPVGDTVELARRLRTLHAQPALREAMGRRGQEWANAQFSLHAYGTSLEENLHSLIAGRGRSTTLTRVRHGS